MDEKERITRAYCAGIAAMEAAAAEGLALATRSGTAGELKLARRVVRRTNAFHASMHAMTQTMHEDGEIGPEIGVFSGGDK